MHVDLMSSLLCLYCLILIPRRLVYAKSNPTLVLLSLDVPVPIKEHGLNLPINIVLTNPVQVLFGFNPRAVLLICN